MLVRGRGNYKPRFAATAHCQHGLFAVLAAAVEISPAKAAWRRDARRPADSRAVHAFQRVKAASSHSSDLSS